VITRWSRLEPLAVEEYRKPLELPGMRPPYGRYLCFFQSYRIEGTDEFASSVNVEHYPAR